MAPSPAGFTSVPGGTRPQEPRMNSPISCARVHLAWPLKTRTAPTVRSAESSPNPPPRASPPPQPPAAAAGCGEIPPEDAALLCVCPRGVVGSPGPPSAVAAEAAAGPAAGEWGTPPRARQKCRAAVTVTGSPSTRLKPPPSLPPPSPPTPAAALAAPPPVAPPDQDATVTSRGRRGRATRGEVPAGAPAGAVARGGISNAASVSNPSEAGCPSTASLSFRAPKEP
mmetsp:Transcript_32716/g.73860  ORF Transcript_32716/g.73860 Transcript_32716/m.73860 type:complete len:226 (+) Transcript_32716:511-1188(+)